jgi:hypothetical protein
LLTLLSSSTEGGGRHAGKLGQSPPQVTLSGSCSSRWTQRHSDMRQLLADRTYVLLSLCLSAFVKVERSAHFGGVAQSRLREGADWLLSSGTIRLFSRAGPISRTGFLLHASWLGLAAAGSQRPSLSSVTARLSRPAASVFALCKQQHGDVVQDGGVLHVEWDVLIVAASLDELPGGIAQLGLAPGLGLLFPMLFHNACGHASTSSSSTRRKRE